MYEQAHLDKKRPATQRQVKRIFESTILPAIGARRVASVTQEDIQRLRLLESDAHAALAFSYMLEFGVADETAWQVGLSCGGKIRVWVEPIERG